MPLLLAALLISLLFPSTKTVEKGDRFEEDRARNSAPSSPAASGDEPETFSLSQTNADGTPIPWGSISSGNSVQLEVLPSRPEHYRSADVHVRHDGADYFNESAGEFTVKLDQLPPGNYQWSAVLRTDTGSVTETLTPPRQTPDAVDFIVPPPILELRYLHQLRFDGTPISNGNNLTTEAGASLCANVNLPGAIFVVEVKPADMPFDARNTLSSAVSKDGTAFINFFGSEGKYHWRARAKGSDGRVTAWQEMHFTAEADFVVISPSPKKNKKDKDNSSRKNGTGAAMSLSSGGGSNQPLPSIVRPLEPLWSFFYSNTVLYAAVAAIGLCLAGVLGMRYVQRRSANKQTRNLP